MKEYVTHFRDEKITVLGTYDEQDNLQLRISRCSRKEQFCKKIGRETARKRPTQLVLHYDKSHVRATKQQFFIHGAAMCSAIFEEIPSMLLKIEK
ncbi:MAG TPA: hypothetical protein VGK47_06170 [Nitrososphaeraceae archaeon]